MPRPQQRRSFDSPANLPPSYWERAKEVVTRQTKAGVTCTKLLPLLYEHFCESCYAKSDYNSYNNFNLGIRFKTEALQNKLSGGFMARKTAALLSVLVEAEKDTLHPTSKERIDCYKETFAVGATRKRLKLKLPKLTFTLFDTLDTAIAGLAQAKSAFQLAPTAGNLREVWSAARFLPDPAIGSFPIERKLWANYCELFYRTSNFQSLIRMPDNYNFFYSLPVFVKQIDANRAYIGAFNRLVLDRHNVAAIERERFLRHFVCADTLRVKTQPKVSLVNKYFFEMGFSGSIDEA